ncbi:hypothetical protein KIH86_09155 [Paenibacillus sp. HN-1]|uniref:NifB/NifX family molybdenum-iron cluster-binding protein n=1 Tax=Paenibacillus TaxID=44249 RepID=UPI001CA8FF7E|nr:MULTISPECIES: NifB/NifX family molybdenum-iron cluster-binding protein [Paenibacillus]MBY9079753.1 hypothetical protein [Paenibacillus sp. CGMCC 1.18879]MBY9084397.1 hypothetical protein [Paenibacillus sinensis]
MRVAFASVDGRHIDGHFGLCTAFSIFELKGGRYRWLESRSVAERTDEAEHDCRMESRVRIIADCTLLFVCSIGGDAEKRLRQEGIMTLKTENDAEIIPQLDRLLDLLKSDVPLWLLQAIRRADKSK